MLLDPRIAQFITWFADLQRRTADVVSTILVAHGEVPHTSDALVTKLASTGPTISTRGGTDWGSWLDSSARTELLDTRTALGLAKAEIESANPFAALVGDLQQNLEALPVTLELSDGSGAVGEAAPSVAVPVRQWFELGFFAVAVSAFSDLQASVEQVIEESIRRLEEVEKVVDYYTLAVERHAVELDELDGGEEFARAGQARIRVLIDELHDGRKRRTRRVVASFVRRTAVALEEATAPLRAHRPELISRGVIELERHLQAKPRSKPAHERVWERMREGYGVARPILQELTTDLRAVFADEAPAATRRAYAALIERRPSELGRELPASYRRLFASLPIRIADIYLSRAGAESSCAAAIERWLHGAPQAVLLHGERGAGKRTVLNQVLARARAEARVRWVRLGPRFREEGQVASAFAGALGLVGEHRSFASLASARRAEGSRCIIVVENAERLLGHTPDGVARMKAFLGFVGETAASTLWVLLMASPAATLLLHRLDLARHHGADRHARCRGAAAERGDHTHRHRRGHAGDMGSAGGRSHADAGSRIPRLPRTRSRRAGGRPAPRA